MYARQSGSVLCPLSRGQTKIQKEKAFILWSTALDAVVVPYMTCHWIIQALLPIKVKYN